MSKIRQWAKANGIALGARGRLPRSVVVDYLMAHPAEARQFLKDHGAVVGKRGRISVAQVEEAVAGK